MNEEEAVNEIVYAKPAVVKLAASTQTTNTCSIGLQTDPEREDMVVGTIIKPTYVTISPSDLQDIAETYANSIVKEEEAADNE
eukprot:6880004-Lingulodinium_polyedra.AAC.1